MGRMQVFMRPMRPIASCTVATPKRASLATAAPSARTMLRLTTPRSFMLMRQSSDVLSLAPLRPQRGVEPGVDTARVAFVDLVPILRAQRRRVDIALRVVEIVACLGVDAAHGADHLRSEQHVVH